MLDAVLSCAGSGTKFTAPVPVDSELQAGLADHGNVDSASQHDTLPAAAAA